MQGEKGFENWKKMGGVRIFTYSYEGRISGRVRIGQEDKKKGNEEYEGEEWEKEEDIRWTSEEEEEGQKDKEYHTV